MRSQIELQQESASTPRGPMIPLSVTIVAQDEERTIGRVLEAVKEIAEEIVFIDSGSTDRTVQIAKLHGVRFYHQNWLGYAKQKNLAIERTVNNWVLSLDADEILTPELVAEIKALLSSPIPDNVSGFTLPRILFIGNTPVQHGGFYPDAQLRLFRKDRGKFKERIVHEAVAVEGEVIQLKNPMLHYSYKDVEHFAAAMDKYARLSAQHYFEASKSAWRAHPLNELIHPLWTFFYRYVIRRGYLDGPLCFKLNLIYADYVRKKIRYLRQLRQHASR